MLGLGDEIPLARRYGSGDMVVVRDIFTGDRTGMRLYRWSDATVKEVQLTPVTGTDRTQVELHIHYDNQEPRWDFWLLLDEEGVRRICDRDLLGPEQQEQANAEEVHMLSPAQLAAAARRQLWKSITVEFDAASTVQAAKCRLLQTLGASEHHHIHLVLEGRILMNDQETLGSFGLKDGQAIHMAMGLGGASHTPPELADLATMAYLVTAAFAMGGMAPIAAAVAAVTSRAAAAAAAAAAVSAFAAVPFTVNVVMVRQAPSSANERCGDVDEQSDASCLLSCHKVAVHNSRGDTKVSAIYDYFRDGLRPLSRVPPNRLRLMECYDLEAQQYTGHRLFKCLTESSKLWDVQAEGDRRGEDVLCMYELPELNQGGCNTAGLSSAFEKLHADYLSHWCRTARVWQTGDSVIVTEVCTSHAGCDSPCCSESHGTTGIPPLGTARIESIVEGRRIVTPAPLIAAAYDHAAAIQLLEGCHEITIQINMLSGLNFAITVAAQADVRHLKYLAEIELSQTPQALATGAMELFVEGCEEAFEDEQLLHAAGIGEGTQLFLTARGCAGRWSWVGIVTADGADPEAVRVRRISGGYYYDSGLSPAYGRMFCSPHEAIGCRLRVKWKRRHYTCTVASYDDATKEHHAVYDDGDMRDYILPAKKFEVLEYSTRSLPMCNVKMQPVVVKAEMVRLRGPGGSLVHSTYHPLPEIYKVGVVEEEYFGTPLLIAVAPGMCGGEIYARVWQQARSFATTEARQNVESAMVAACSAIGIGSESSPFSDGIGIEYPFVLAFSPQRLGNSRNQLRWGFIRANSSALTRELSGSICSSRSHEHWPAEGGGLELIWRPGTWADGHVHSCRGACGGAAAKNELRIPGHGVVHGSFVATHEMQDELVALVQQFDAAGYASGVFVSVRPAFYALLCFACCVFVRCVVAVFAIVTHHCALLFGAGMNARRGARSSPAYRRWASATPLSACAACSRATATRRPPY
jgi:hypothetical protein